MANKIKNISITAQAGFIKSKYPASAITTSRDLSLTWIHTLKPSPLGDLYKVKLEYNMNSVPKVFVLNPKPLALAKEKTKLEHCYDQGKQQLCLYLPNTGEWCKDKLLVDTLIPWTMDWLYHYEIWLCTGEWTGGGVHPTKNKPKVSA